MFNIILLVWTHWFADFFLQTDWMAVNKSKSNKALLAHCAIYGACLIPFGFTFALLNALIHFGVDYCTSRWTSKLFAKGDRHNFFVVIGLDQAIHITTLILTYGALQ